jgi:hypothetical protein
MPSRGLSSGFVWCWSSHQHVGLFRGVFIFCAGCFYHGRMRAKQSATIHDSNSTVDTNRARPLSIQILSWIPSYTTCCYYNDFYEDISSTCCVGDSIDAL